MSSQRPCVYSVTSANLFRSLIFWSWYWVAVSPKMLFPGNFPDSYTLAWKGAPPPPHFILELASISFSGAVSISLSSSSGCWDIFLSNNSQIRSGAFLFHSSETTIILDSFFISHELVIYARQCVNTPWTQGPRTYCHVFPAVALALLLCPFPLQVFLSSLRSPLQLRNPDRGLLLAMGSLLVY